jgi:hypothetical protein
MGETRDQLMQQTQAAAKDTFNKVQQVAGQVVSHVVEEARTVAEDTKTIAAVAAPEQGLPVGGGSSTDNGNSGPSSTGDGSDL